MVGMSSRSSQSVSLLSESFQLGDRRRGDGCPGALRVHEAKDGGIGRIRFAGGQVSAEHWSALADVADGFGDGNIHLTTRGNLQIRGISDAAGFAAAVKDCGFVPSPAHDRMRNIVVSPFAPELLPLVAELDAALLADDVVPGLSGRTLFAVDSGAGDVAGLFPDFGVVAHADGFQLIVGGQVTAHWVAADDAAEVMVTAARAWQQLRGKAWRVAENPEAQASIVAGLSKVVPAAVPAELKQRVHSPAARRPVGWLPQSEGVVSLGAGVRFGQLSSQIARLLGVVGARTTVTPWHVVVVHDVAEAAAEQVVRVLAPLGLVFDANSPWLQVSACTGSAGCEKSLSDTRADAAQAIAMGGIEGRVHFSGCERRCGHPLGSYTDYLATGVGEYEVSTR